MDTNKDSFVNGYIAGWKDRNLFLGNTQHIASDDDYYYDYGIIQARDDKRNNKTQDSECGWTTFCSNAVSG